MRHPPLFVTFSIHSSICPSIHCALCLRNCTSSDHNFWYKYVKWWYQSGVFFIFLNFDFLGKNDKKRPIMTKNSVALHISGIIHHMIVIYVKLVWNDISSCFFIFSKFWFSGGRGVKGQKMTQNEKKFCLLRSISQEPYIISFSYMVHICKLIISMGIFFTFFKI